MIYAVTFITLALVFYTVGVWKERFQGKLKIQHLVLFYIGLICDTTGTKAMERIAQSTSTGILKFNFHSITGGLALLLMLVHAIWATIVLIKKKEDMIQKFHKFSIIVWLIWLIPFISGAIFGMTK